MLWLHTALWHSFNFVFQWNQSISMRTSPRLIWASGSKTFAFRNTSRISSQTFLHRWTKCLGSGTTSWHPSWTSIYWDTEKGFYSALQATKVRYNLLILFGICFVALKGQNMKVIRYRLSFRVKRPLWKGENATRKGQKGSSYESDVGAGY